MNRPQAQKLLQEAFDALRLADLISEDVQVSDSTVLLGPETILDSIAFVTFIVEVEDRLQAAIGESESVSLAIYEIHEFNPDKSRLTAGTLIDFILGAYAAKELSGD